MRRYSKVCRRRHRLLRSLAENGRRILASNPLGLPSPWRALASRQAQPPPHLHFSVHAKCNPPSRLITFHRDLASRHRRQHQPKLPRRQILRVSSKVSTTSTSHEWTSAPPAATRLPCAPGYSQPRPGNADFYPLSTLFGRTGALVRDVYNS